MKTFEERLDEALVDVTHRGWKLRTKTKAEKSRDGDFPDSIVFVINGWNYDITTQRIY